MQIIMFLTGALLALTGVGCLALQGVTFASLAFAVGIVMLLTGAGWVLLCVGSKRLRRKWKKSFEKDRVTEGILVLVMSVVILSNLLITEEMVPLFFGMWLLVTGILRCLSAIQTRSEGTGAWNWTLGIGIICLVGAVMGFVYPILEGVPLTVFVGICFLMQGGDALLLGLNMERKISRKEAARIKKTAEELKLREVTALAEQEMEEWQEDMLK